MPSYTVDRRALRPPEERRPITLAGRPKPAAPPPDPFEIGRIGLSWSVIRLDATKKRGLARRTACGTVREISLADGVPSCGCAGSRQFFSTSSGFAHDLVQAEAHVASGRHRGRR